VNKEIYFGSKTCNIGCPVNIDKYVFIKNYCKSNYNKQFCLHWSATNNAAQTFSGLNARGLSVNFIIDDDENASIYQCLDLKHGGYSQGRFNSLGAGVEISYYPDYYNNPNRYEPKQHKKISTKIHGENIKVFLPSDAQINSLYKLLYGICVLTGIKPNFPIKDGKHINTIIENPDEYSGLINHYNLSRVKIDCCGLNLKEIETEIKIRLESGIV
jgi:hypothetical protein